MASTSSSSSSPFKFFILLILFLLHLSSSLSLQTKVDGDAAPPVVGAPPQIDCGSLCDTRCSKSSRPNLCNRACNTCCDRCACVPPGTSGNHDMCPCYANMVTKGGKKKCP